MSSDRYLARRVSVVYKGQPLMPMRWGRAAKYVKLGKAKFRLHRKLGIKYLELLEKPCNTKTQKIVLAFDPGTIYDGFSVVSDQCHHENFELIHNKNVKKRMDKRKTYRKLRRSRLRNRPAKFESRTKSKLPPTIQSMLDYRLWLIDRISQIFPISHVVYERPRFNFWKKKFSGYATKVMQGLNKLVEILESKNLVVIEKSGFETKERRVEIFGKDVKNKDKGSKSFFAHCFDSYCLATIESNTFPVLNKKTRFITKIWHSKRELHRWKCLQSSVNNKFNCNYKKIHKGGEIEILDPWYGGRKQFVKVRLSKYPNNFSNVITEFLPRNPRYKHFRTNYGGTMGNGISKYSVYKNLATGDIITPDRSRLCKSVASHINQYQLVEYKRRLIEITK